jgi:D-amino-acid dehydrogenase
VSKRVVVVGAGVVGLSVAYYAARKGHRVTVVDRAPGPGEGCSYVNAGLVVPSHVVPLAAPGMVALALRWIWSPESPFHVRPRPSADLLRWGVAFWRAANAAHVARSAPLLRDLHLASRRCFEELAASGEGDLGLVKNGLLVLCRTEHGLEEEAKVAELSLRLGIPATICDREALAALEPDVRMEVTGAVHYPMDCHLTPARLMDTLVRAVGRGGGTVSWDTEVTGLRRSGRRVEAVQTNRGEVLGDEIVLCAGVWSAGLARDLGLALPMEAGKGYSLTLDAPRVRPRIPAILSEARVAVTPMGASLRFGGTMELSGLDASIDPARVRGITRAATRYYPALAEADFEGVPASCGMRPCSPDGLPYVGRSARHDNLCTATGHAMMGVSLGPITGQLVAEIVSGEEPSMDIRALHPDRHA